MKPHPVARPFLLLGLMMFGIGVPSCTVLMLHSNWYAIRYQFERFFSEITLTGWMGFIGLVGFILALCLANYINEKDSDYDNTRV